MPVEQLSELFGPIIGGVIALLMVPVIIVLWKNNLRLQKEKDELGDRWINHFLKYGSDSLRFTQKILEAMEGDQPDRNEFRQFVRDFIVEQRAFMQDLKNKLGR